MTGSAPAATESEPLWDDGKEPGALRTIGEVGQALGIKQHVLRYWEDQFALLRPLKRSGGRRYYRPDDIALVRRIDQLLHKEGYTLRGARLVLESEARARLQGQSQPDAAASAAPVPSPLPAQAPAAGAGPAAPAAETLARLTRIRDRLAAALQV